jgi:hypothetical protein
MWCAVPVMTRAAKRMAQRNGSGKVVAPAACAWAP